MLRGILFCALFLSVTHSYSANFSPADSIGVTKLNGKLHLRYLVSPGETIYGISTRFHVAVSDLLELNPELESGLKVGQVILIPYEPSITKSAAVVKENKITTPASTPAVAPAAAAITNSPVEGNRTVHKVQAGETLYSLSKRYNVSVDDLLKWNNMDLKAGQEVIIEKPSAKPVAENATSKSIAKDVTPATPLPALEPKKEVIAEPIVKYDFDSTMKQVLIIPFDPYLYFSDADDEIAATSKIPRTKVRQVFRRRMNALLDHPAYENIHLLGGKAQDSLTDLNKIYGSVTYNYQDILYNPNYKPVAAADMPQEKKTNKSWIEKQKEKIIPAEATEKPSVANDNGKYFGVVIRDKNFFNYFNSKYDIDYYIFVNQFEVKTNYENCLDRAAQNYERTFTTHYSIFDSSGKQIAGNKFKTHYNSNSNHVDQIVGDNMNKITTRIIADLPVPRK